MDTPHDLNKKKLQSTSLYSALNKCKSVFWCIFWFSFIINLLVLFVPLYTSQVLDRVLSSGSLDTLAMLSIVTILSIMFSSLLESVRSMLTIKINEWLDEQLSNEVIKKSIDLVKIRPNTSTGQVLRDLTTLKSTFSGNTFLIFFDAPWSIIYLIALFLINTNFGIIALIGIAVLSTLALFNDLSTNSVIKKCNEEQIQQTNELDIAARNSEVLEAMGMTDRVVNLWNIKNSQTRKDNLIAITRSSIVLSITKAIRSVLQISVIGVGAYMAIESGKSPGSIIAASILLSRTLSPFELSINNWKNLTLAKSCYDRLQRLLAFTTDNTKKVILPEPKGQVTFTQVFYTPYGTNKPTIKNISFEVPPGKIVGIIGNNASGKSTIAKLITGVLKPISGSVRLDGGEINSWNREIFGRHTGYLPQNIELFNASIKDNISRMDKDADIAQAIETAQIIGIHEYILKFPDNYETLIGGDRLILSGGQKQLIGLCRALYGKIKLLVLDEPDSNLDNTGRECLQKALNYAKNQKITTFIITHNMSLLQNVDLVLSINSGFLVNFGERDSVLNIKRQNSNLKVQSLNLKIE